MKLTNNTRFFLNIFSIVMIIYGAGAVPPFMVAVYLHENDALVPLGVIAFICIAGGILIRLFIDMKVSIVRPKMNYMTTIFTWLIMIGLTTIVYFFGRAEFTWIDSLFEATASLTTTGMGNLDVNIYPYSLQLWRSILNWLGGVGVILIAVSFIPSNTFSSHSLISVEVPGPEFLKSTVTFRNTYKKIVYIYILMTVTHFILLVIFRMDFFTAVLTALSNVSTAGMQHISNGVITQLSMPLKIIITIFAFLGSVNISFFIMLMMRKNRMLRRRTEVGMYCVRILVTAAIISAAVIFFNIEKPVDAIVDAVMQTVSFLSTSGYIVSDCHKWPLICQLIILLQMFVGACAVSTGGGIKIARVQIAFRTVSFGLIRHIHPQIVRPVRFNNESVKSDQLVRANLFVALFMAIYVIGALFLSLDNKSESIFDALNYSQAMITNTGTSIAELEAPGLAGSFSPLSKIVMSIEMLAGRLEIYPVLMLFSGSFWRKENKH